MFNAHLSSQPVPPIEFPSRESELPDPDADVVVVTCKGVSARSACAADSLVLGERANAWRYRDYVIRAFNEDKPYDRFLREQLAGDELPPSALAPGGQIIQKSPNPHTEKRKY